MSILHRPCQLVRFCYHVSDGQTKVRLFKITLLIIRKLVAIHMAEQEEQSFAEADLLGGQAHPKILSHPRYLVMIDRPRLN